MQERTETDSLDARDYLRPAWERKWLILGFSLLVTAAAVAYSLSLPKQYTASTRLFLQSSALDQLLSGVSPEQTERTTLNQSKLLESESVARAAARKLDLKGDPESLLADFEATPEEGSDFLQVVATREDPKQAADLANAVAQAFGGLQRQAAQERAREALSAAERQLEAVRSDPQSIGEADEIRKTIRDLRLVTDLPASNVVQVDPAETPTAPSSPKPLRNGIFAFLISLLIAVAGAYLLGRIDRRLRRPEDIEAAYGWPVIGSVSRSDDPTPRDAGQNLISPALREDFRTLRTNLQLEGLDKPLRTIAVVSAIAGEGKSVVVRNLALVYGEAGMSVAVVEADLRRPTLAKMLSVEPRPGLTDALLGHQDLARLLQPARVASNGTRAAALHDAAEGRPEVATVVENAGDGVSVLTSGEEPANPPAVLASAEMRRLLENLADTHDVVLIDSPPLLVVSDIVPLIPAVDGLIVVSRLNRTSTDAAARLRTTLSRIPHARVLGVVANDRTADVEAYGYYRPPLGKI